jgi:lipopolysaccharide biosynthesis protein
MKLISFYLPGFYENQDNNDFWGKGFTEWNNVKRGTSLFPGHLQPRLPKEELGLYDLNDDSVRYKQMELAKKYGIDAWCYYYYRFNKKRPLRMPLDRHFNDKTLNMPFLICWANESWTKNWDGSQNEILIEQKHNFEDDLDFIKEVSPMFLDYRYLKIENKPVLLVYQTALWKDIKKTVDIWRTYVKDTYDLEIYLIKCNDFDNNINPIDINFDSAYQFPPHGLPSTFSALSRSENGLVAYYNEWPKFVSQKNNFKLFRGVMTSFDNTPRRLKSFDPEICKSLDNPCTNGGLYYGSTPKLYQKWLEAAIKYTLKNFKNEEQIIFINAWNEWGEGAVLEPCNLWGHQYLEATLEARRNSYV